MNIVSTTGDELETETQDISSDGFYCVVPRLPESEEMLSCDLTILQKRPGIDSVWLHCRANVVRVEKLSRGGFGIGCRILDYSIVLGRPNLLAS